MGDTITMNKFLHRKHPYSLLMVLMVVVFSSKAALPKSSVLELRRRERPLCEYNPYNYKKIMVFSGDNESLGLQSSVLSSLSGDFFELLTTQTPVMTKSEAMKTAKEMGAQGVLMVRVNDFQQTASQGETTLTANVSDYNFIKIEKDPKTGVPRTSQYATATLEIPYEYEQRFFRADVKIELVSVETNQTVCEQKAAVGKAYIGVRLHKTKSAKILSDNVIFYGKNFSEITLEAVKKAARGDVKDLKAFTESVINKPEVEVVDMYQLPGGKKNKDSEPVLTEAANYITAYVAPLYKVRKRQIGEGRTKESKEALLMAEQGHWDKAGKLWKQAVTINPKDHDAWGGLGIYYEYIERKAKAKECYLKAREISAKHKGFPVWLQELDTMLNDVRDVMIEASPFTSLSTGESVTLTAEAGFEATDTLTYSWNASGGTIAGIESTVTYTAPEAGGTYNVSVTVSNETGESVTGNIMLTVSGLNASLASLQYVQKVAIGLSHACALIAEGTVKCWGDGSQGQLGRKKDETDENMRDQRNEDTPSTVDGINTATEIAAGENFTCAFLLDGLVKCWGEKLFPQIGKNIKKDFGKPYMVTGLKDIADFAFGTSHTCALLADRTIKCWGANNCGQLGDGSTLESGIPVYVAGVSNATQIMAGDAHSCALLGDGTIKCWGNNVFGRLGSKTKKNCNVFAMVDGIKNGAQISGGLKHTCALLSDGTVKCWGTNNNGILGSKVKDFSAKACCHS